jgi:RNA polymerase sigma-70 factor (ECF subfamily)
VSGYQAGSAVGYEYTGVERNRMNVRRSGEPAGQQAAGQPAGVGGLAGVPPPAADLVALLAEVAKGDEAAFRALYDRISPQVLGIVIRVVRDPAQSEEVMQEVLLGLWRNAARFDPAVGSANAWIMTQAHRRAVDRVRSQQSASDRELRAAVAVIPYDEVAEAVQASLEHERVRHCLAGLTAVQRETVTLAFYGGYSYREVAQLLDIPVGTVKTRMRDGLIRLRDCMGVE